MTSFALHEATKRWSEEVEREMVKLIEQGVPPYQAAEKANKIVSDRRARATLKKDRP